MSTYSQPSFSRPRCSSRLMVHIAYFGNFSLRTHSFDHIATSDLKSDVISKFGAPVSRKDMVISCVQKKFQRLL